MPLTNDSVVDSAASVATFRLKGGLFPFTLLEINRYDLDDFELELQRKVAEAPAFFQQTPVILSIDLDDDEQVSLQKIVASCRDNGLIPVVLRGGKEQLREQALTMGMALMPEGRAKAAEIPAQSKSPSLVRGAASDVEEAPVKTVVKEVACSNKVITKPVRSGQQVYAVGGDLIVLSSVSTGAEVLADGNIHIYGALRGRALAGVKGDTSARIFCHSLEAELISVAGDFKLDEDYRGDWWKKPVQISLDENVLSIRALT